MIDQYNLWMLSLRRMTCSGRKDRVFIVKPKSIINERVIHFPRFKNEWASWKNTFRSCWVCLTNPKQITVVADKCLGYFDI